jgi:hypothetical protein
VRSWQTRAADGEGVADAAAHVTAGATVREDAVVVEVVVVVAVVGGVAGLFATATAATSRMKRPMMTTRKMTSMDHRQLARVRPLQGLLQLQRHLQLLPQGPPPLRRPRRPAVRTPTGSAPFVNSKGPANLVAAVLRPNAASCTEASHGHRASMDPMHAIILLPSRLQRLLLPMAYLLPPNLS